MAAPKRTPEERERDLVTLSRMFCRGVSIMKMAQTLEVDRKQIRYDIEILLERWGKLEQENVRAVELAKINHLEATYWEAWERSLTDRQKTRKAKRSGGQYGGVVSEEEQVERRDGNVEFLRGAERCIELRCKILGLIVKKVARTDADGKDRQPLPQEKKASAIEGLLAYLGSRNGNGDGSGHADGGTGVPPAGN